MSSADRRARAPARLPNARELAARVIERVDRDAAFAAATLDAELKRYPQLDPRDRALATELTYGTLRVRRKLTEELQKLAPRGLPKDTLVQAHLLLAAYQLRFTRVPSFAAVDEAVTAIRGARGPALGGFANALLRKFAAAKVDEHEPASQDWLLQKLIASVGADEAEQLVSGAAPLTLRQVGNGPLPDWFAAAAPGRVVPSARRVQALGDPRQLAGYSEGNFVIQEEGAQLIGLTLNARGGERVLDACAGRGQKTTLIAEQLGSSGELWASDLHPKKLAALEAEHRRLGLVPPRVQAVDWSVGGGELPRNFDRILVDAPCTGTGTLRRRPEIGLRLGPEDPLRMSALQQTILRNVAAHLKPGGYLVYAVCSVLPEEAEVVVDATRDLFVPVPFELGVAAELAGPGASALRLLPGKHGTDGYFIASLRRR